MTLLQLLDLLAFSLVSFEEKLAATKFSLTDMFIFMQIVWQMEFAQWGMCMLAKCY